MTRELLASLDEAFNRRSWHGTNLRGALRRVDLKTAAKRPQPGRHNIWELVVHAAYWKYDVRRRLKGEKPGGFALEGANFWTRPTLTLDGPGFNHGQDRVGERCGAAQRRAQAAARGG